MAASRRSSLFALIGVVLVGMTGFGIFLPVFPFLALHVGATAAEATWAMGAYSLGQLVAAPLWGRLSDRIGRKPILIAGLLGASISYIWLAQAQSVLDVASARLFAGLMAGNVGAAFAAAADLADEKTRARNMGLLGAAVGFAFVAGPFFGAMLAGEAPDEAGFDRICYYAAGFAGVAALGALLLFHETLPRDSRANTSTPRVRRWALLMSRPLLARFSVVMLLMITAQALMEVTFGLWGNAQLDWGPRQVGWALGGLGLMGALLQGGIAGRAARAWGERLVLFIGLALFAAGFAGLGVAREAPAAIAALVAIAAGAGFATPALQSLIAAQAGREDRGAVMGLSQSAAALGRVVGPAAAGLVIQGFGASAPFVLGAVILLAALMAAMGERAPAPAQEPG